MRLTHIYIPGVRLTHIYVPSVRHGRGREPLAPKWLFRQRYVSKQIYTLLHNIYVQVLLIRYNNWFCLIARLLCWQMNPASTGTHLIFRFTVTENDRSLLVFISQKVSQTANLPVVTSTVISSNFNICLYLFRLSFIFSATGPALLLVVLPLLNLKCSLAPWTVQVEKPAPWMVKVQDPAQPHTSSAQVAATGRHAYAELHFYTTQLYYACRSIEVSRLSSFLSYSSSCPQPVNTLPDLKLTVVIEMEPLQKQKRAVLSVLNIAQPVLTKALL